MKLLLSALAALVIFPLSGQDFSAELKPHSATLRHGTLNILIHKNYPLVTIDGKLPLHFSAQQPDNAQTLELLQNTPEIKAVQRLSRTGKNRDGENVQTEIRVTVRNDFPGIFISSKTYNRDFIGAVKCKQLWSLPVTTASLPAENGELRLGTAWKKLSAHEYFLYTGNDGKTYGIITTDLRSPARTVYSNIGINDFGKSKGSWFFGISDGEYEQDQFSEIKWVLVPVRNIQELKTVYDTLKRKQELQNLWKY